MMPMKKHFFSLLGIVVLFTVMTRLSANTTFTAGATAQMKLMCDKVSVIEKTLMKNYGEELFLKAESASSDTLKIYMNKKNRSYTIVRISKKDDSGCILDAGTELRPFFKGEVTL